MNLQFVAPSVFLLALCASARLGETADECKSRYGTPVSRDAKINSFTYAKNGFTVMACFYNGKASFLSIEKSEKDDLGKPKEISKNEISSLLNANSNGKEWKELERSELSPKGWSTEDRSRLAGLDAEVNVLIIATAEYMKFKQDEETKKESKNVEGF